jgi:hypothetical protein
MANLHPAFTLLRVCAIGDSSPSSTHCARLPCLPAFALYQLGGKQMPHREEDATDPKSRHLGKCESEAYLAKVSTVRPLCIS